MKCGNYEIHIGSGLLNELDKYIEKNDETIILTDTGIPEEYIQKVESLFINPLTLLLPQGEDTKSIDVYKHLLEEIASRDYSRGSQIIALGGGVVGDLAGFVAATYLRGVTFIQIPTTLLSQVDSSVGSKVAINHFRKNNVGTFYDPSIVIIDIDTLSTLPKRELNNGMAEVIKYAFTLDKGLLKSIDSLDYETIIRRCIELKIEVVNEDKFDTDSRHILNFGHTIGHAIEIHSQFNILHGEAISVGMYKMIHSSLRELLKEYLQRFSLPLEYDGDYLDIIRSDKKIKGDKIKVVKVNELGKAELELLDLKDYIKGVE